MAIVTMTDAVADTVASSSEYNKVTANIRDLDARLGAVLSTNTAHARLTALENITADTATAPGGIGNQRLADRFGTGVGTGSNVTTGSASSQLGDLRTRMTAAELVNTNQDAWINLWQGVAGTQMDACYVYQASDQVIGSGTAVTMDSELTDTNAMHSTVTNTTRITIKKAGLYIVGGFLGFVGGGLQASRRVGWIAKNGTVIPGMINSVPPSQNAAWITAVPLPTAPVQLAVNDYLELFGYWGNEDTTITGANRKTAVTSGYNPALFAMYHRP